MKKTILILVFLCITVMLYGCNQTDKIGSLETKQPETDYSKIFSFLETNDGCCIITDVIDNEATELFVPETINDLPVIEIDDLAFQLCVNLKKLSLPNNLKYIADDALVNCRMLEYNEYENGYYLGNENNPYVLLVGAIDKSVSSFNVNSQTKIIGPSAFSYCLNISEISLPNSITSISSAAFKTVSSKHIKVNSLPLNLERVVGGEVFSSSLDETLPSLFKGIVTTNYTEYNNAYYAGNEDNPYIALIRAKNTEITSCEINPQTKIICNDAFYDCKFLTTITIPESIKQIGKDAFSECNGRGTIINTSLRISGAVAFNISNLKQWLDIYFEGSYARVYPLNSVSSPCAFFTVNNENVTTLTFPDGTRRISDFALRDYFYENITLPEGFVSLGMNNNIKHPERLPNSLISTEGFIRSYNLNIYSEYENAWYIGNESNPFLALVKLKDETVTSCVIHDDTKFIFQFAFTYGANLTYVKVGKNVKEIGSSAFENCRALKRIDLPEDLTHIRESVFRKCTSLSSISIPTKVKEIGNLAFCGCDSLETITIPDSVNKIGNAAFSGCNNLERITIPKSVKFIGSFCFSNCEKLTGVYIEDLSAWCKIFFQNKDERFANTTNPLYFAKRLFLNYELITDLVIPEGITRIQNATFINGEALKSITLCEGITEIGSYSFRGCNGITEIDIPAGVTTIDSYAFSRCSELQKISLPSSLVGLHIDAFYACTKLTEINNESTFDIDLYK